MQRQFYEPGNGTRYDIIYGNVPGYANDSEVFVLTWMLRGGSGGSTIAVTSFTHWTYVQEKMNVQEADAKALAEFINSMNSWG